MGNTYTRTITITFGKDPFCEVETLPAGFCLFPASLTFPCLPHLTCARPRGILPGRIPLQRWRILCRNPVVGTRALRFQVGNPALCSWGGTRPPGDGHVGLSFSQLCPTAPSVFLSGGMWLASTCCPGHRGPRQPYSLLTLAFWPRVAYFLMPESGLRTRWQPSVPCQAPGRLSTGLHFCLSGGLVRLFTHFSYHFLVATLSQYRTNRIR